MRPEILYLTDILQAVDAIERFSSGVNLEALLEDEMRQAAILQKLIIIGEAAARLSDEFHQRHDNIPWGDIVGFRNIAVHEYFSVDWQIVWTTATQDVPALRTKITELLSFYE